MQWEIVIGLEVHTQLSTHSKIFSGSSIAYGAAPNTQASAVDIALPGVLPVLNRGAVERAIKLGLALGANINRHNVFDRKNYFYPDLPKGYQISQLAKPIVEGGALRIVVDGEEKTIHLTRAHLEEDAGKSIHGVGGGGGGYGIAAGYGVAGGYGSAALHQMTGIDLNRAGTPLLEIVSEPEMRSAAEAVAYARALHALVTWIGICDGNMQEGSFRVDANVSVRPQGSEQLGTRREIKNLNSFRFLEQAINYEARWQIETLQDGGRVVQATVLFDPDSGETRMMRSKEDAHDYRYFPDPDLLPVVISEEWIERVRAAMPELPGAMRERFIKQYKLSDYDASALTQSKAMAVYFEETAQLCGQPKLASNWVMGEVSKWLNAVEDYTFEEFVELVPARNLAALIVRIDDKTISNSAGKSVFVALTHAPGTRFDNALDYVDSIIKAEGLKQISDSGEIERIIDEVMAANAKSVEEFRAGKEKAFNALIGQVMRATQGKANPQQVNDLLKAKLAT